MKLRIFPLAVLALSLAAAGCEHPCLTLAKRVCNCEEVASDAEDCKSRVKAEKSNIDISDAEKALCEVKLETCTCEDLDTPTGQARCGLAYEPNASADASASELNAGDAGISAPTDGGDAGSADSADAAHAPAE